MKKFICPVCDQSDIVKENDLFVCQGCGTKYHAEEVRERLREETSPAEVPHDMNCDKPEAILARSVPATTVIDEWKKKYTKSRFFLPMLILCFPILIILSALMQGYDLEYFLNHLGKFDAFIFWGSVMLAFFFFVAAFGAGNKADEKTKQAQISAKKENITVTNLKIYGSTSTRDFSIPCSEIKNTYTERTSGNSSIKISNDTLCVVCKNETLRFEYLENNSEILNAIKTVIPHITDDADADTFTPYNGTPDSGDNGDNAICNIKITDYASYFSAIKAIREITLMDYAPAKHFLDNLPSVLVENISKDKADKYAQILEQNEVHFEIYRS